MRITIGEDEYQATPNNAYIMYYDNDILNGLYVDLDEEYLFLSAHHRFYNKLEIEKRATSAGILTCQMHGEVDMTQPPHCYVMGGLGRFIAQSAEGHANGYYD